MYFDGKAFKLSILNDSTQIEIYIYIYIKRYLILEFTLVGFQKSTSNKINLVASALHMFITIIDFVVQCNVA